MMKSLITIAGLFVFSLFLTPQKNGNKEETPTISYTIPKVKTTEELIKETELYSRLEVVEAQIEITEEILYANTQRPIKKPIGKIFKEVDNDTIHICDLHPASYHNDYLRDSNGFRD